MGSAGLPVCGPKRGTYQDVVDMLAAVSGDAQAVAAEAGWGQSIIVGEKSAYIEDYSAVTVSQTPFSPEQHGYPEETETYAEGRSEASTAEAYTEQAPVAPEDPAPEPEPEPETQADAEATELTSAELIGQEEEAPVATPEPEPEPEPAVVAVEEASTGEAASGAASGEFIVFNNGSGGDEDVTCSFGGTASDDMSEVAHGAESFVLSKFKAKKVSALIGSKFIVTIPDGSPMIVCPAEQGANNPWLRDSSVPFEGSDQEELANEMGAPKEAAPSLD